MSVKLLRDRRCVIDVCESNARNASKLSSTRYARNGNEEIHQAMLFMCHILSSPPNHPHSPLHPSHPSPPLPNSDLRLLPLAHQRRERPQEMARALVPVRIPLQVQLVVLLGRPPPTRGCDLGHDGARVLPPLRADLGRDLARDSLLLLVVEVDGRAVLGPRVGSLAVEGCRVVGAVEEFEELAVGDLLRVEDDLRGLGV